jgi:hypothetical protein
MPQTHTHLTVLISVTGLEQIQCALCRERLDCSLFDEGTASSRLTLTVSVRSGAVLRNRKDVMNAPVTSS